MMVDRDGWRKSQRNPCCRYALMMIYNHGLVYYAKKEYGIPHPLFYRSFVLYLLKEFQCHPIFQTLSLDIHPAKHVSMSFFRLLFKYT